MINLKTISISTSIVIAIAFTGCSSKGAESSNKQVAQEKSISISEASQNMRNALNDMKIKFDAKDEAGAIKVSAKLEENWSIVEDNVKNEDKELYEKVEGPLDTINGGVKIKPLDTKTLTNAMNSLDNILIDVQKLK
jgi:iron uptake system EfeUOB component EfeO/EfeM